MLLLRNNSKNSFEINLNKNNNNITNEYMNNTILSDKIKENEDLKKISLTLTNRLFQIKSDPNTRRKKPNSYIDGNR